MRWLGPDVWANRLQDWRVRDGWAECGVSGRHRAAYCLTHRVGPGTRRFSTAVRVDAAGLSAAQPVASVAGFRLGAKGRRDHYLSAVVYGTGLDVGVGADGRLRIGDLAGLDVINLAGPLRLAVDVTVTNAVAAVRLTATSEAGRQVALVAERPASDVAGPLGLLSHHDSVDRPEPAARFASWTIEGEGLIIDRDAAFGPVAFAAYTLHRGTLKLTAQLTPVEAISGSRVTLEVRDGGEWTTAQSGNIDPLARTVTFRVPWRRTAATPYRVRVALPARGGLRIFDYAGTIAAEPVGDAPVTAVCFSCNCDHGFPDEDVAPTVLAHRPHLALFVGDQFYESHGGFGIQSSPMEMASLDYLRKWYMFGLSYRDVFRHISAAFIPDDHDVYHGNIWGEAGAAAPIERGWGAASQDQGGYKMPPAWVNMVQRTQTSHLPDPYDPTPVGQDIGVYYTAWDYGGLSLALLEDRKFKSAPTRVMPASAKVVNGFATAPADLRAPLPPTVQLLGDRQEAFLEAWSADWQPGTAFKVVVSQTAFCAAHSLPAGATSGDIIPTLPLPAPGEYVAGDAPAGDMDTNGWPKAKRDLAVRAIRKGFAVHVAGDQHLASVAHYGVERHRDAGFVFTVPALNNLWPRRWWPTPAVGHQPLPGSPAYTGDFEDAFGNPLTMHAVANPRRSGERPAIIHDRATGYGVMVFNKAARTIRMECWPRALGRATTPRQYAGWPVTIEQRDNYPLASGLALPELEVVGLVDAVIQVVDAQSRTAVYTLRIAGTRHRPSVPAPGAYDVRVGDGTRWWRTLEGLRARPVEPAPPTVRIDVRGR